MPKWHGHQFTSVSSLLIPTPGTSHRGIRAETVGERREDQREEAQHLLLPLLMAEFQGRADTDGVTVRGFNSEQVWSFVTLPEQPKLYNFPLDQTQ